MTDHVENSLTLAVRKEAGNLKQVGKLYASAAKELIALVGDAGKVHLYMSAAQDATTDPGVWKRSMQGMRDSLKPLGYTFTGTRDFRPAFRTKNPLFAVDLIVNIKAAKDAASATAAEQAEAIEAAATADNAAELARIDAETTPFAIAASAASECDRLGLNLADVLSELATIVELRALEDAPKLSAVA